MVAHWVDHCKGDWHIFGTGFESRNGFDIVLESIKKQTQLLLAKLHYEEALRFRSKIYGPTHPESDAIASNLADVTSVLSRIPSV
jgi:hypothetical protein